MIDYIPYNGWSKCARISNGKVEVIVTTEVGPRIVRLGFTGGQNFMQEVEADKGQTGGDKFRFYGGHRLWHSPEHPTRTYFPENGPVQVKEIDGGLHFRPAPETPNGIQKELEVRISADEARLELTHRLLNVGPWAMELAPWAITACAAGGTAVIPLPPRGTHTAQLLPTSTLALWAYTDLSDPRWTLALDHILLRQSVEHPTPQKMGALVPDGWAAYALNEDLLVKHFKTQAQATYPDFGCSAEVFTNGEMLEVETLGPVVNLQPGATVEHVETWNLYHDAQLPGAAKSGGLWPLVKGYAEK